MTIATATRGLIGMLAVLCVPAAASAKTILFVGNSFTFAHGSPLIHYKADTVTDLNKEGIGGMPALFKVFAAEAGLSYDVTLETAGGKGFDFHYTQKLPLLDKAWDEVVLQGYSTLDQDHPGDPALTVKYAKLLVDAFAKKKSDVKVFLDATWSRADLTYPEGKPWHGKPIEQMGIDVEKGYELAAKESGHGSTVVPVGLAFNRAMATGVADPNPYDGVAFGQLNLWTYDQYHASVYGYYLETLMVFGRVTGRDPLSLGAKETAAVDLGLSPKQAEALEQVAHDELAAHGQKFAAQ